VADVLGERMNSAKLLDVTWLETTVLLNRGTHFQTVPLPVEAQLAPAFGASVGDMNGDGSEDVFLSQNFFAVDGDTPRYDAGRGLWLAGDGQGMFRAVPGQTSGVKIYGEQRGSALCDYDADGRLDLVVAQNGAQTKLYKNVGAQPGLRVRLQGRPGNPDGIGAVIRLMDGDRMGPAREVHAGCGYWSLDSAVQILRRASSPRAKLWVRWPGGRITISDLPVGAKEVVVNESGGLRMLH
jgi:hypothetical protein